MKDFTVDKIRNVALIGHGSSGKTTLAAAVLFNGGITTRLTKVDKGNTLTDFEPEEIERKISISSAACFVEWKDVKINLLDTPGYSNFLWDTRAALRAVDGAVVLVDCRGRRRGRDREGLGYDRGVQAAPAGGGQQDGPRERQFRTGSGVGPAVLRPPGRAGPDPGGRGKELPRRRRPGGPEGLPLRTGRKRQDDRSAHPGRGQGRGRAPPARAGRDDRRERREADGEVPGERRAGPGRDRLRPEEGRPGPPDLSGPARLRRPQYRRPDAARQHPRADAFAGRAGARAGLGRGQGRRRQAVPRRAVRRPRLQDPVRSLYRPHQPDAGLLRQDQPRRHPGQHGQGGRREAGRAVLPAGQGADPRGASPCRRHRGHGQAQGHDHQRHPGRQGLRRQVPGHQVPRAVHLLRHRAQDQGRRGQDQRRPRTGSWRRTPRSASSATRTPPSS